MVANAGVLWHLQRDQSPGAAQGCDHPVVVHGRKEAFSDRVAAPRTRVATASLRSPAASPGQPASCWPCWSGGSPTWAAPGPSATPTPWPSWPPSTVVSSRARWATSDPRRDRSRPGAQSIADVEAIRQRFNALNPYDTEAVPDMSEAGGHGHLLRHLGQALCPLRPGRPGRAGLRPGSPALRARARATSSTRPILIPRTGMDRGPMAGDRPAEATAGSPNCRRWINRPTMVRTTVTSPPVLRAFRHVNEGRTFADR